MFIEIHLAMLEGSTWSHMFTLDETAFWSEKILRPIIVYAALIVLLRFFGKRELGQLNPFDLVVILSLSNTVQNAIIGQDNSLVGGIVGACALLGINYLVAFIKYNNKTIESVVEGKPLTVIENSRLNKSAARREFLTEEDLNTIAHREGLDDMKQIKKCVLDPNGNFLIEGNTPTADENFREEVLKKLEELTRQIKELKAVS